MAFALQRPGETDDAADTIEARVVFEVISVSSLPTETRVKALDDQQTGSTLASVMLECDRPLVRGMRRSTGRQIETAPQTIDLPEVGLSVKPSEIYR